MSLVMSLMITVVCLRGVYSMMTTRVLKSAVAVLKSTVATLGQRLQTWHAVVMLCGVGLLVFTSRKMPASAPGKPQRPHEPFLLESRRR